jgi:hypothetical protein
MQLEVWVFAEFSSHVFKWQGGLCITMARLHFLNNGKTTQFLDLESDSLAIRLTRVLT